MKFTKSGVTTEAARAVATLDLSTSPETKKNVWSLMMGPPRPQEYSLREKSGMDFWKTFFSCRPWFVKYMAALPCHSLFPLFVMMFTSAEAFRPYSAEKLFTDTRTSCTLSAFGFTFATPLRWLEVTLPESTRKLFDSVRAPFACRF